MGLSDVPKLALVALVVLAIGLLLHIVAIATTRWVYTNPTGGSMELGLWRYCAELTGNSRECKNLNDDSLSGFYDDREWYKAVQGMECLGLIGYLAAVVLIVLGIFLDKLKMLRLVAAITAFVTGVFLIIGVIVYGAKAMDDDSFTTQDYKLHYSFGLAVVSGALAFVGGGLGIGGK